MLARENVTLADGRRVDADELARLVYDDLRNVAAAFGSAGPLPQRALDVLIELDPGAAAEEMLSLAARADQGPRALRVNGSMLERLARCEDALTNADLASLFETGTARPGRLGCAGARDARRRLARPGLPRRTRPDPGRGRRTLAPARRA